MEEIVEIPMCDVTNVLHMDTSTLHSRFKAKPNHTVTGVKVMENGAVFARVEINENIKTDDHVPTHNSTNVLDMETGSYYHRFPEEVFDFLHMVQTKVLGSGSNGNVVLVEDVNRRRFKFAAKLFSLNSADARENADMSETFLRETGILQSLNHKNIVEAVLAGVGPTYGVIVFDFFPEGPLYQHIGEISKVLIWKFFINLLSAVQYLHGKRIVHRDIKLDNILVKRGDVFLTDFGLSEKLAADSNLVCGFAGTDEFVAPEVLAAKVKFAYYDGFKADAYSMGVFLWCLLMESDPGMETKCWASLKKQADSSDEMDPILVECARMLLLEDPKERVNVQELMEGLKENGCIDELKEKLQFGNDGTAES